MRPRNRFPIYFPLSLPLLFFFFLVAVFFVFLFFLQLLHYGFAKLGFSAGEVLLIIFGALLGSAVNIPVKRYVTQVHETLVVPWFFGMRYRVPVTRYEQECILAVNFGGCVVPVIVSVILIVNFFAALLSFVVVTAICTLVVNRLARVIRGVGIVVPFFIPPLVSALFAMLLSPAGVAPAVAYVSGALGTLIGADLLNIPKIRKMGTPVMSIGGAGTWDGIFLSSLVAAILVPAG